jgi:hypothetical protein
MIYDSAIDGSEIRLSCCGSGLRRDELEVRPRRISILIIGIKYYISSHLWGHPQFRGNDNHARRWGFLVEIFRGFDYIYFNLLRW